MKIEIKGQFATISIEVEGSLILANKELVKALTDSLKETIIDLDRELCKNMAHPNG